jgi:carbon storage regulator
MLVLSRQRDETIVIGDNIEITVVDIRGDNVRLGISGPKEVPIHRKEVWEAIKTQQLASDPVQPQTVKNRMWFTADFHFLDDRMQILGRPFANANQCADKILEELQVVKPEDDLYVLGDVAVSEEGLMLVNKIPGKKHLVLGNYDKLPVDKYLEYFHDVHRWSIDLATTFMPSVNGSPEVPLHLVHYPTKAIPEAFNLCGNIHSAWKVQKNILNVGVDVSHFRPVSLESVEFYYRAICKFYDQDVWCSDHPANTAHKQRGKAGSYWETNNPGSLYSGTIAGAGVNNA